MGGGKDQKQANQTISKQSDYQVEQQKKFDTQNSSDLTEAKGKGDDLYKQMREGYGSLASGSGSGDGGGSSGGGGGGGGGYAADTRFSDVQSKYQDYMKTGGWSDERTKSMDENIQGLKELGKGGVDEAAQARIRGGGVYDEFAKTGGLSDQDVSNMRARGNLSLAGMYKNVTDAANNQASVQGGYGPGASVMAQRQARQQASAMGENILNTETGITDTRNKGRQWGAQGMTSSEMGLQGLLSDNKYKGLTGAADVEKGLVESKREGEQWGTQGLQGMAENDRSFAASQSAQGAANDRWAQQFAFQQKMAGLEGLGSLYTSSPEEYQQDKELQLKSAGVYGDQVTGGGSALKQGNKRVMDDVIGIAGAVM